MRKLIILLIVLSSVQTPTWAQTNEASDELSGTAPQPGDVPVDGGLSLLLAAGAAYGAGRLRRRVKGKDSRID